MMNNEVLSHEGRQLLDRRTFFDHTGRGLAGIALSAMLFDDSAKGAAKPIRPKVDPRKPHMPRQPHFAAKTDNVVLIFASGACSHLDTWDYKPQLIKQHGKPLPGSDKLITFQGAQGAVTQSPYKFKPRGECGKHISDLVGHIGDQADDICFIHSMKGKTNTHGPGENYMSTGFNVDGFPSTGAWVTYALGSQNRNLPAFVAIPDPRGVPQSSVNNWGPGFLPAAFQGTAFNADKPIRHLKPQSLKVAKSDKAVRDFLRVLNDQHLKRFPNDTQLAARIASYELAARMQLSVPKVTNLKDEPAHILKLYGADSTNKLKAGFARNCILARRLVEKGVRFVQLFNGAYAMGEGVGNWDGHKVLKKQYDVHGPILDQPVAGLLKDLKQRGLLKRTLVVWCSEFGRMPTFQKGASGRDHNPAGFTTWMAGAGVKAPYTYGSTDDFGHKSVTDVCTVHDFHATILHLLGLDHKRLSFYHNGIERRLTDVHGNVVQDILA